jgi:hypothetical protein
MVFCIAIKNFPPNSIVVFPPNKFIAFPRKLLSSFSSLPCQAHTHTKKNMGGNNSNVDTSVNNNNNYCSMNSSIPDNNNVDTSDTNDADGFNKELVKHQLIAALLQRQCEPDAIRMANQLYIGIVVSNLQFECDLWICHEEEGTGKYAFKMAEEDITIESVRDTNRDIIRRSRLEDANSKFYQDFDVATRREFKHIKDAKSRLSNFTSLDTVQLTRAENEIRTVIDQIHGYIASLKGTGEEIPRRLDLIKEIMREWEIFLHLVLLRAYTYSYSQKNKGPTYHTLEIWKCRICGEYRCSEKERECERCKAKSTVESNNNSSITVNNNNMEQGETKGPSYDVGTYSITICHVCKTRFWSSETCKKCAKTHS